MTHELKILPKYFQQVWDGKKTFELRKDDRDYNIGDQLRLLEYSHYLDEYSGRECNRSIPYILINCEEYGLKDGFVILGIK